jgi:hypothetical protein
MQSLSPLALHKLQISLPVSALDEVAPGTTGYTRARPGYDWDLQKGRQ